MTSARMKAIMIIFISASPIGSMIRLFMLVLEYLYEHKDTHHLRPQVMLENGNTNHHGGRGGIGNLFGLDLSGADHHHHHYDSGITNDAVDETTCTFADDFRTAFTTMTSTSSSATCATPTDRNTNANDTTNTAETTTNNSTMASIVKYMYDFMTPFFIPHTQYQYYYQYQYRKEDIPQTGLASFFYKKHHLSPGTASGAASGASNTHNTITRQFTPDDILRTVFYHHAIPIGSFSNRQNKGTSSLSKFAPSSSTTTQDIIIEGLNQDVEMVLTWIFAFTALIIIPFSMIVIHALLRRGEMENERYNKKIELYTACLEEYCQDLTEKDILVERGGVGGGDNNDDGKGMDSRINGENNQDTPHEDFHQESKIDELTPALIDNGSEEEQDNLEVQPAQPCPTEDVDRNTITNIQKDEFEAEDNTIIIVPKPGITLEESFQKRCEENKTSSSSSSESPYRQVSGTCAICLQPYDAGDKVVWSSFVQCPHVFHYDCVTTWIQKRGNSSCPCCRRDFIDTGLCRKMKRNHRELRYGQL